MTSPSSAAAERYRRQADVRFRIIDREAVILRQRAGENLVLNEVGSSILSWLDKGHSIAEVEELLPQEYDVDPEDAKQDLHHFLEVLHQAGVIEPLGGA